jgi:tryptophanyl-tRNA synthetase
MSLEESIKNMVRDAVEDIIQEIVEKECEEYASNSNNAVKLTDSAEFNKKIHEQIARFLPVEFGNQLRVWYPDGKIRSQMQKIFSECFTEEFERQLKSEIRSMAYKYCKEYVQEFMQELIGRIQDIKK